MHVANANLALLMVAVAGWMQLCGCGLSNSPRTGPTGLDRWLIRKEKGNTGDGVLEHGREYQREQAKLGACSQEIANLLLKSAREGDQRAVQRILRSQSLDVNTPLLGKGMARVVTLVEVAEEEGNASLVAFLMSIGAKINNPAFDDGDGDEQMLQAKKEGVGLHDAFKQEDKTVAQQRNIKRGWVLGPNGLQLESIDSVRKQKRRLTSDQQDVIRSFGGKSLYEGELAMKGTIGTRLAGGVRKMG